MKRSHIPALALALAPVLFPCATDDSPRFVPRNRPEQIDQRFIRGELGILTPTLRDTYLLVAWRYLSGKPLSPEEQTAATAPRIDRLDPAVSQWQQTVQPIPVVMAKLSTVAPNQFYMNCLTDAFATANATLADRRQTYGSDALVQAWLTAQNQVFSNCSGKTPAYPAEPDQSLPPLARADRLYQIAAAHFYAEDFDGARERFRAIANDPASPWQSAAKYLQARVLLREITLLQRDSLNQPLRAELTRVADDPTAGRFQKAARQLSGYAESLSDPAAVVASTARQVSGPQFSASLDLASYILNAPRFHDSLATPGLPEPFDWLEALEQNRAAYSLERWKATRSDLWLVPAILQTEPNSPDAPELIAAAKKLSAASPAFDTATYQAIRLTAGSGDEVSARAQLDKLLSGKPRPLASVDNAFRAQRMSLATGFDDFLRWAPRKPIGYGDETLGTNRFDSSPVLDNDSIQVIDHLPLNKLTEATESIRLPAWSAAEVALIGITRALALHDDATAAKLTPILAKAHPKWAEDLNAYKSAHGEEKRFTAALLIERHADFREDLWAEFRTRDYPTDYSWWCAPTGNKAPALSQRVLTEKEQTEATQQRQMLIEAGAAQTVIAPAVMAWAQSHPEDKRVPEALYRLVRLTRYGCRSTPDNGAISKAAFDLLHQKYPDNDLTKKTPYWFKD